MTAFEFRLPDLGEGIREAEILEWSVEPGDRVRAFDPLCRVESAKAAVELTSPVDGRIAEARLPAGATAHVGEVLVVIDTDSLAPPASPLPLGEGQDERSLRSTSADQAWFGIVGSPPRPPSSSPADNDVRAAPLVRKMARQLGVRLEDVTGTGPGGRVLVSDLEAHAAPSAPSAPSAAPASLVPTAPRSPPGGADDERIPLTGLRKRVADHMVAAFRHAPQVTAMDLFDVTDLVAARERLQPAADEANVKLSYLPFVVKAAVEALRAIPHANATFDEDAQALVVRRARNVGIATAVPGGLVVPVVKRADVLSILEIAAEIARLTEAARARHSAPDDLRDGTFTITSFGGLPGSPLYATPIVNHPEVAILGVGRIELQPRVVDGQIVPRHCMGVSFTFDHRVLDGADAGRFLAALRRYLEQPLELLLRLR